MTVIVNMAERFIDSRMNLPVSSGGSRNWEGGGAPARVWQGVGRSSRRGQPGEGAGGGHPSRPARGCGGAL